MLTKSSFRLNQEQINQINAYFKNQAIKYREEGEDPILSVKVEFEWVPGLGRFVTAIFDGGHTGLEIEECG